MSHPATDRLKFNPPLGRMPALQNLLPHELQVDPAYQRSLEAKASQTLVNRIAQHWNWDLCQPLVVSRRANGDLFVIDGQHRLEAAKRRGDIAQLPCVVVGYASAADEAASFVHLNQQRRPLTRLDLFKAALASGDTAATALAARLDEAGLSVAPHTHRPSWKPGMVDNIGGLEAAWKAHGPAIAGRAMDALAQGFPGVVLHYAGTIYPGLVAVCADEMREGRKFAGERWDKFTALLACRPQDEWRFKILKLAASDSSLFSAAAAAVALRTAWAEQDSEARRMVAVNPAAGRPAFQAAFRADAEGKAFCGQCDRRVTVGVAQSCADRFCSFKAAA